jgi:hypothetical protein
MRYIFADPRPLELSDLAKALNEQDPAYQLEFEDTEGILHYAGTLIGHLTLNRPGDGLFDEELAELREFAEDADGPSPSGYGRHRNHARDARPGLGVALRTPTRLDAGRRRGILRPRGARPQG